MSFGFSVGDFVTVFELANKIRKEFADAPGQFKAISDEVRSLSIVLQDVDVVLSQLEPNSKEKGNLDDIAASCGNVLEELKKTLDKYSELESKTKSVGKTVRRAWKRLKWEPEDIRELRTRISSNIALLNTFNGRFARDHTFKLVQHQDEQQNQTMLDWLTSVDFATQQSDVISRRQEGTGIWFADSPKFLSWVHGFNQTLFCPGIPGAGKTIITAIAVDHLWKHVQSKDIGVAYIYCNYKTQADQTAINLAAAILKQLIQERPSIAEPVANLYSRHAQRRSRPSLEEIQSALQIVVSNYSKVYVAVDALDECLKDHRSQLLGMLRGLQSNRNVSFMATSRFIPEVVQQFALSPTLEVRADDSDVKRFVAGQIYRLPRCVQRDDKLQEAIKDGISTAVDGMFLLARLHLDSLVDKTSKKKILSTLAELPKGSEALDKAYNDAIKRIEGQLSGHLEPGDSELDQDNIPDVEEMVSVCAGLVMIDDESKIIRLVHYTTQEYFDRIRESWNPRAQQEIATACLIYLSFNPFKSGSCPNNKQLVNRLEENVFLGYASRYWGHHIRTVQEQVCELASFFLQDTKLVSCAVQITSIEGLKYIRDSQHFPKHTTGIHLTAGFGLIYLSERLLSEIGDVSADSKNSYGRTPLLQAAQHGHEAVVKLLVERDDVEADSENRFNQTPLIYAAMEGHEAVVRLLVERDDVNADSKDTIGRTSLSYAATEGHETVVRLLVERDDVNADSKDNMGRTPLSHAARRGHEAVVRLLLERFDVEADSKDNDGRTPLSYADKNGHEAVMKLLRTSITARLVTM